MRSQHPTLRVSHSVEFCNANKFYDGNKAGPKITWTPSASWQELHKY